MVQFKDVTKVFKNGLVAIKDIDFVIDEGEFVFLIGPSGSGKTTLIELLIRDEMPSRGSIFFDDQDITHFTRNKVYKLRRQIGVIFQDFKLIEDKTAYENVAFAMEAAGRTNKEIKETVPYVLEIVGLESKGKHFPVQLSGGEQQRVAIARAIANSPKLLIADEPTGNLDPASAWDIVQILTKINNWGTTVLMSTHGTDIVNTLNKRVIQMEGGLVIRDDSEGQYEFSRNIDFDNIKSKVKKSDVPKKQKTSFKININDMEDKSESEVVEEEEPKTLFGRLFRSIKKHEVEEEKSMDKMKEESFIEEEVEDKGTTTKSTKAKKSLHLDMEDKSEKSSSDKKTKKGIYTEKTQDVSDKKANKVLQKQRDMSVEFMNLPKSLIDDLKSSGYKTLGQIIDDGPESLNDKIKIDPQEVILVAQALEQIIEENK